MSARGPGGRLMMELPIGRGPWTGAAAPVNPTMLGWAGVSLAAGGLLWQPLLAFENLAGLHRRSLTWQWYLDQWGFLVAMTLLVAGMVGLDRARVVGQGVVGRAAMHVLVLAWGTLTANHLVMLVTGWDPPGVGIVAGLLTYPSALVAGVAVLRGGRWAGWRRWTLLGEGAYETLVILVPIVAWNWGPSWATEAGWQLCWVGVGIAALAESRAAQPFVSADHREPSMMRP